MFPVQRGPSRREQYWRRLGAILLGLGLALAFEVREVGLVLLAAWPLVAASRLHDLGRGAWWAVGLVSSVAGGVLVASLTGPLVVWHSALPASLALAVCALWLGLIEDENGFRRPPGELRPPMLA